MGELSPGKGTPCVCVPDDRRHHDDLIVCVPTALAVPPGLWDGKWENQRLLLLLQLLLLSAQRWHQRYCASVAALAALAAAGDQSRKPARQTAAAHRDDVRHLL